MHRVCWLFLFILFSGALFADAWSQTRLARLVGPLDTPLAVEPYIPQDFVAMAPKGSLDLRDWVYWGPREVLEAYFMDQKSLHQPILRLKLSENVQQNGPDSFTKEDETLAEALAPVGLKRMYDCRMKWGKYPIYAITAQFEKKWLYAAWVGLSDAQGTALMFELVYPGPKPTQEDFLLWNSFLDQTKTLDGPLLSEGFRLTYKPGMTELTLYGSKIRYYAEQRGFDRLVQIIIDSSSANLPFTVKKVTYEFMMPGEYAGGPAAKIYGQFTSPDRTINQAIPILVNSVRAFSMEAEEARQRGFVVYQEKLPTPIREYIGVN